MAGDENQPPIGRQQVKLGLHIGPGLRVKNHVETMLACDLADFTCPILPIVEHRIGAQI